MNARFSLNNSEEGSLGGYGRWSNSFFKVVVVHWLDFVLAQTTSVTQLTSVLLLCQLVGNERKLTVQALVPVGVANMKMKHNFQEAFPFYHNFLTCSLHSRWLFSCTSRESLIKVFFFKWKLEREFRVLHYGICNFPPTHFSINGYFLHWIGMLLERQRLKFMRTLIRLFCWSTENVTNPISITTTVIRALKSNLRFNLYCICTVCF